MHDHSPAPHHGISRSSSDVTLSLLDESRLKLVIDEALAAALADLEARLVRALKSDAQHRSHPDDALLTERDVAALLRVSTRTVRRLECAHDMPASVRVGGCKRFVARDIRDWLGREQERARWSA